MSEGKPLTVSIEVPVSALVEFFADHIEKRWDFSVWEVEEFGFDKAGVPYVHLADGRQITAGSADMVYLLGARRVLLNLM